MAEQIAGALSTQTIPSPDRENLAEALARSEDRFQKVFHASPAGIAISRLADGCILDVNSCYLEIVGYPRSDLVGHTYDELGLWINCDQRQRIEATLESVGHIHRVEAQLLTRSRAARTVLGSVDFIQIDDAPCMIANLQDITERRQAEEGLRLLNAQLERRVAERTAALEAANRELETFSYSVSHDLRAPLRSVRGFTEVVLEQYGEELSEPVRQYLKRVQSAGCRMNELIDDLLALSRIARAEVRRERVDLTGIVWRAGVELQSQNEGRLVKMEIQDDVAANADDRLLTIVLDNLIGNAWKYSRDRPLAVIEFGMESESGKPIYFVRDNGAGFSMEYAHQLFVPFQRLHSASEFEGTGIGLATVERIIQRHGGRIWAEAAVGRGATFYFTLGETAVTQPTAPTPVERAGTAGDSISTSRPPPRGAAALEDSKTGPIL